MTDNKLKVGIAGYGVVGKRRFKYINQRSDMCVSAVCDKTFTNTGILDDGTTYYDSYQTMLDTESLDVLFVCRVRI